MATSISGISSGIDWQSLLEKLREVEEQKLEVLETQQSTAQEKLSAWSSFSGYMSALQTSASELTSASSFNLYSATTSSSSTSVSADDVLTATASSSASKGSYDVVVTNLAQVEKLSSASFSSQTTALGKSGTILINGKAVTVEETDTLKDLRTKINAVNSGDEPSNVIASIVQESTNSFKLVLTSETAGAAGMSLQNGSTGDTLVELGFNSSGTVIKNAVTGGAQSDAFSAKSETAVEALLGIEDADLEGATINGQYIAIDLSDDLETIKETLVSAGLNASIVEETSGTDTLYRLKIEGMTTWSDPNNVLQSLGLIEGSRDDQMGIKSSVANTLKDGTTPIDSTTNLTDIYGYLQYTAGDKITISGVTHGGTTVAETEFAINSSEMTTVGDLLTRIEELFGGETGTVTASITSDGKIEVVDSETGESALSVNIQTSITGENAGSLSFGTFSEPGAVRKYVVQEGEDAAFTVDGISMTSTTNSVTTAIQGVTLDLAQEDPSVTVTVQIDTDGEAIEEAVQGLLDSYNSMLGFINGQMSYDTETETTGGPLFGNNTLKSIKMQLQNALTSRIGTADLDYLTEVGIGIDSSNNFVLDSDVFQEKLQTNFTEVVNLFANSGTFGNNNFEFVSAGRQVVSGEYEISVTGVSGLSGTIDGKSALASGDVLTLNDSSSNANGLSIKYLGSDYPVSSTIVFTRGIAGLIESMAYNMTTTNGTIDIQKQDAQGQIDLMTDKIASEQARIDQKMAALQKQYESMEVAVANLNAIGTYLSQQFSSS